MDEMRFSNNPAEFDQALAAALDKLRGCEVFFVIALNEGNDATVVGGSRTNPARTASAFFAALPELVSITHETAENIGDEEVRERALRDIEAWTP